jgi:hypothetical protein
LRHDASLAGRYDTVEQVLKHFESVVFGNEYEIEGVTGATQIQKWVSPVRIGVNAMKGEVKPKPGGGRELKLERVRPSADQIALVRKHLTTLVRMTGVKNEAADKAADKPANLVIRFLPRLAMGQPFVAKDIDPNILAKLGRAGVCYFVTSSIRSGAMFRGLIVVNNELPPDQMDACLLEEMTQAFGLPNDSDIVSPSIFNQKGQLRALSKTDVAIVKTLYDRRLPAGTPRADAMRLARNILAEKLAE